MLGHLLGFYPFDDEICYGMGLYCGAWFVVDLERQEFDRPLRHAACGIFVVNDI